MTERKCPETWDELEAEYLRLEGCRDYLTLMDAKLKSGAAYSKREATRQIAKEIDKPEATIRTAIRREIQSHKVDSLNPDSEIEDKEEVYKIPTCTLWTRDQESYTPAQYIEAAREVMGSIDLDPASNEKAQQVVKAKVFFTKEDNGLDKPWDGNIFLNPPYSHPEVKYFVDKLLEELKPGQQAILLTNNNTDTNFFHDAVRVSAAVCFTKGRINFLKPDGSTSSPTNGQVFYYFGDNVSAFLKAFSKFGAIMKIYDYSS